MKPILMSLLLCLGIQALAWQATACTLRTRISDDGRVLSIQIEGTRHGKKINYERTFDVAGMNDLQKEILKHRVFSAVGASRNVTTD